MRRMLLAGGCMVLAVGVVVTGRALLPPPAADVIAEITIGLRERGEPVTLAEVDASIPPGATNGAAILDDALAWLDAHLPDDDWKRRVVGGWNVSMDGRLADQTPEKLAELSAFLDPLEHFYVEVERAAACDEIAWPLGPLSAGGRDLDHVPRLQRAMRFLHAGAVAGDGADARLRSAWSQLAIGRRLRVRNFIDDIVAATFVNSACGNVQRALGRGALDGAATRERLEPLLREPLADRLPEFLRRERAALLELLPSLYDGSAKRHWATLARGRPPTFFESVEELYDDVTKGKAAFPGLPEASALPPLFRSLDDLIAADPRDGRAMLAEARRLAALAPPVFSSLPRFVTSGWITDAVTSLTRVALAACVHRDRHGAWPDSTDELAPLFPDGVPLDPFTDAPFLLEIDGDDLVLAAQPWPAVIEGGDPLEEHGLRVRLPPR